MDFCMSVSIKLSLQVEYDVQNNKYYIVAGFRNDMILNFHWYFYIDFNLSKRLRVDKIRFGKKCRPMIPIYQETSTQMYTWIKTGLINNIYHMRISGIEISSKIPSQSNRFKTMKSDPRKCQNKLKPKGMWFWIMGVHHSARWKCRFYLYYQPQLLWCVCFCN